MSYKSIVCGVTGSAHAQKAALKAAVLAKENDAQLTYVYVVDTDFFRKGIAVELSSHFITESLQHLGTHILGVAEQLALTQGITPKKIVKTGRILEALQEVVKEEKADLLVLGHEERTFFEKALFKGDVESHVEELKKKTGIDVSVVR
jgi:nucleotide-binding universal stress UspA family protein